MKRIVTLRKSNSHKILMTILSWWRLNKTIVSTKMSILSKWICLPKIDKLVMFSTRGKILYRRALEKELKDTI